jgi:hypothetical protein
MHQVYGASTLRPQKTLGDLRTVSFGFVDRSKSAFVALIAGPGSGDALCGSSGTLACAS